MVDVHCHILPGIDDGAKDTGISLRMVETARDDGIDAIVATPHFMEGSLDCPDSSEILKLVEIANNRNKELDIDLEILPGCEAYISPCMTEMVEKGQILTLNHSRYVLIELPMGSIPPYTENVIFELQLKGFIPIIAHPERNRQFLKDMNLLSGLVEKGAQVQMNTGSLMGVFGGDVRKKAIELIKGNMVSCIATDAHTVMTRPPKMESAFAFTGEIAGRDAAERLFIENPQRIIENQALPNLEPMHFRNNRYFSFAGIMNGITTLFE